MLDRDELIDNCLKAVTAGNGADEVRQIIARAVSEPAALIKALGEPKQAGVERLYVSDTMTVLNVIWKAGMNLPPHDHRMWSVIGIYTGREDNILWRRPPANSDGRLRPVGAMALCEREVTAFGVDVIHSVLNPIDRLSGAIHVYGGEFFRTPRSQWDAEALQEQPIDLQKIMSTFAG